MTSPAIDNRTTTGITKSNVVPTDIDLRACRSAAVMTSSRRIRWTSVAACDLKRRKGALTALEGAPEGPSVLRVMWRLATRRRHRAGSAQH